MKSLVLICFSLLGFSAIADYVKTCDAQTLHGSCYETAANFGSAPACAVGLPSDGRHCSRADDLGVCRRTTVHGPYTVIVDMYYYDLGTNCNAGQARAECVAKFQSTCVNYSEGQWTSGDAT